MGINLEKGFLETLKIKASLESNILFIISSYTFAHRIYNN